jgi:DivIVA domain-containing protein
MEPLTPQDIRDVAFDRAPLGKRGYDEKQVDAFLDRIEATLSGTDALTAEDVRGVTFSDAPRIRRGYHEDQVDDFLDLVVSTLELRDTAPESAPAAQHPDPAEETSPMLFPRAPSLPADDPAPLTEPVEHAEPPADLLALPLPPAPPGARGYRVGDVEKLARLLAEAVEQVDGPTSADLMTAKLNRTFFNGQGYHTGAVDALLAAWVDELRHRES